MKLFLTSFLAFALSSFSYAGDPPKNTPELLKKGSAAFTANCVTCHGEKGDGLGDAGKYMSPHPRNFATDKFKSGDKVTDLFKTITKGLDGTAMAGFPDLPEADRWGLAYYVLSFKRKK